MPRRKKVRRVRLWPEFFGFRPLGSRLAGIPKISLGLDELEALRLVDLEGKDQLQAAKQMGVSQSTFQRILSGARKKVAQALVVGRVLELKGGEHIMFGFGRGFGWFGRRRGGRGGAGGPFAAGPGGWCVCTNPECKHKVRHQAGVPCYQQKCPKCGSPMIRER
jgi:hypothetical protein